MSAEQLEEFMRAHGHYPRAKVKNGESQTLEVYVAPGYAIFLTHPRGAHLYVQRDALAKLKTWLDKMLPLMEGEFDVPTAILKSSEEGRLHLREQRLMKRQLYGATRRAKRRA